MATATSPPAPLASVMTVAVRSSSNGASRVVPQNPAANPLAVALVLGCAALAAVLGQLLAQDSTEKYIDKLKRKLLANIRRHRVSSSAGFLGFTRGAGKVPTVSFRR